MGSPILGKALKRRKKFACPVLLGHMAAQEAFRARPGGSGGSKSLQKINFYLEFPSIILFFFELFPRSATPKPPVAQRAGGISVYLSTYVCIHTPNVVFAPRVDLEGPCLYIYIYIYLCASLHRSIIIMIHIYIYLYICLSIYMCAHMNIYIHIRICIYIVHI